MRKTAAYKEAYNRVLEMDKVRRKDRKMFDSLALKHAAEIVRAIEEHDLDRAADLCQGTADAMKVTKRKTL